jgi:hypothetical protein
VEDARRDHIFVTPFPGDNRRRVVVEVSPPRRRVRAGASCRHRQEAVDPIRGRRQPPRQRMSRSEGAREDGDRSLCDVLEPVDPDGIPDMVTRSAAAQGGLRGAVSSEALHRRAATSSRLPLSGRNPPGRLTRHPRRPGGKRRARSQPPGRRSPRARRPRNSQVLDRNCGRRSASGLKINYRFRGAGRAWCGTCPATAGRR